MATWVPAPLTPAATGIPNPPGYTGIFGPVTGVAALQPPPNWAPCPPADVFVDATVGVAL